MRLSRSDSVVKRRKDQKLRNKFKGKKKHKKLDAIYEKGYNKSHRGVPKVESSEFNNEQNELELRRSSRARKAPMLLDSSPLPPKKRRKVDNCVASSVEKVKRVDRRQCETPCSSSSDGESDGWRSRLRSRQKSRGFSGRVREDLPLKGKRKLFQDLDRLRDEQEPQFYKKKEHLMGEKSTVVKSKRPGRIKASNVLENDNQEVDLESGSEDGKQKNKDEILEVIDEAEGSSLENKLECTNEIEVDCNMASQLAEGEETAIEKMRLEECNSNGNVETREEQVEQEKLACDIVPDLVNVAEFDCGSADQTKDEGHPGKPLEDDETMDEQVELEELACDIVPDRVNAAGFDCGIADQTKEDGHPEKPLEDDIDIKPQGQYKPSAVTDRKPRIKLGRRCGLCGGGTDGKPPKILLLEGGGSDNEAYSGSSASEEPNYDVCDGFGDQSGWLGRLLGPINDRFGIAGIWVHQQCAVWSPEVYFAGLGCLKNVRAALYRGKVLKCSRCRRPGATIGCRVDRCPKTYHLPCARAKNCIFDHRKFLIACTDHRHLFQPYGIHNAQRMKKLKAKKLKFDMRKMANDSYRKDIEAEEKWLENCGEDEEFLKRESKRLQRDLWRIAPTYIGGANSEQGRQFAGWESVAGLQDVIQCMKEVVILPLLYPEFFNNLGLTPPRGVLLHGYPGTGKTLVVRALVGCCARGDRRIAYFARKGADCLGKYVGDAERQLRLLFQVAEKSQPSIIFFDEIDGLAPCRTKQQDQTHNSVVSTLLALMDGLKSRGSVIVIGATNRPDSVDPALRRPGRFDREIYFPLPSSKDREAILSLHTQKWPKPIAGSLLKWVAKKTVGFAGADLQALCTQAAIFGLRRSFPLQKVLAAAGTNSPGRRCPAIPNFAVDERDWLKALSCAPPPCSRRESAIALNDVVSSPLKSHLLPCLLLSLTRLLVCLCLDERVWLPSNLKKACKLIKNVIVSVLDDRQVQSDNWWLHVDGLLQDLDVRNEIEKNLLLANLVVGESNLCSSDVADEDTDEHSGIFPSKSLQMGARTTLSQNMSCVPSSNAGFQVLICGNPRSGQRHLASCLLHCFVGNVDVWKLDLASISHEGHGDMVHGLTRILMRSAGGHVSMLYMPMIDLWAIETYDEASEDDCETSKVAMEYEFCPSAHVEGIKSQTSVRKASYLWTSFVEQVESIRVNSSLIILATAEVPFSLLPDRVRLFFGNEILNCSQLSPLGHKVPQFSVQLDGKFDHDKVINSFAAELTKDLVQYFIQSHHGENHVHINPVEVTAYPTVDGDNSRVCHSKPSHVSPFTPGGLTNKTLKGKSSLQLAISTFGYQILYYPHFAELCWYTSKLKEGPCANASGPWKGWPFNTCIVRPFNSKEDVTAASSSSNVKSKEYGSVRGLVAVGLSAYRGEYNSLREVCSGVRKVLEALVGIIDDKIQAGKDRTQFIRLLSQVAYLEDMVSSWAHALHSLEVDAHIPEAKANVFLGPSEGDGCKIGDPKANVHGSEDSEKGSQEVSPTDVGHSNPTDFGNECADAGDEVAVTVQEPSHMVVPDDTCSRKCILEPTEVNLQSSKSEVLAPNGVNLESSKTEIAGDHAELEHVPSIKLSNGFMESSLKFHADGPSGSVDKQHSTLAGMGNQPNCLPTDNCILSKDTSENSGQSNINVNYSLGPKSCRSGSLAICVYQCCLECFVTLNNLLLGVINVEWKSKGSQSAVEDVHDFVASLSANLHLSLSKLCQGEISCGMSGEEGGPCRIHCMCRKSQTADVPDLNKSDEFSMKNCDGHATGREETISQALNCRFVFKDGVLANLDTGTDVSYHCKYEKLCLCFLIEWLVTSNGSH
ncbi:uncharacterized protein LOC131012432 [Salvia miltiorrhiza]|uniref:uncharacterized protein LOC131012432 n=1 Tax=Salvia miltiorrhiza TaxID=226208 RepID=UPI0025AD3B40|nr:uncharacterized protein LOC131012432 [Salvia miltiorrhiza]XP_057796366.1 uncharacterized protein LOC131012432 [Salvia miltiorrhiza]